MTVAVIGSGPTGVAAAIALLAQGVAVDVIDVGHEAEPASGALAQRLRAGDLGADTLRALQQSGPKSQQGLGAALKLLIARRAPASMVAKTHLGSGFTFRDVERDFPLEGVEAIPRSYARGGLSNVWGSACYPLRLADYDRWPITEAALRPHYEAAARLLDLEETEDDLAGIYPVYSRPRTDVRIVSRASAGLLRRWDRHQAALRSLGVHFGRARTAVRHHGDVPVDDATAADFAAGRVGCQRCGLCLWGCAWDAIYRSTRTLARLQGTPGMRYRPGHRVQRLRETAAGTMVESHESLGPYDAVFLAAGPLSSLRILVESLEAWDHRAPVLDNDMYLVPSIRGGGLGAQGDGGAFALSEAVMTFDGAALGGQPLHLQLYSYGEFLSRGLKPKLGPLGGPAAAFIEQFIVTFVYMHSDDSAQGVARVVHGDGTTRVQIDVTPNAKSRPLLRHVLGTIRRHPRAFGFLPIPMAALSTGLGFSGHICGTVPMRATPQRLESHADGRVEGTRATYVVDSSPFPALPAQNLTYSAMANAHRVATAWGQRAR